MANAFDSVTTEIVVTQRADMPRELAMLHAIEIGRQSPDHPVRFRAVTEKGLVTVDVMMDDTTATLERRIYDEQLNGRIWSRR